MLVTILVRGTMGHIAPEYLSTGKSSERTDVFGYGIMLLKLVTGQRAIDFLRLEKEDDVLLLDHAKNFDPDSLKGQLPKAVSSLECATSEGKGRVYIHCTTGLGRASVVAIAYMFWFCNMDRWRKYGNYRLSFMERHCPPIYERKECLVPPHDGYKPPIKWPKSGNECWYRNVPYKWINNQKSNQNWLRKVSKKFLFPGGGTTFPHGVGA